MSAGRCQARGRRAAWFSPTTMWSEECAWVIRLGHELYCLLRMKKNRPPLYLCSLQPEQSNNLHTEKPTEKVFVLPVLLLLFKLSH